MDDHFKAIYHSQAVAYHHMIAAEDVDANLLSTLTRLTSFRGKRVVDLGTGTGRIPLMLKPLGAFVVGLDLHAEMLHENARQRALCDGRWPLVQADMRDVPFPANWAHVAIAGWAIGHFTSWYAADWCVQVGRVLANMSRLVRPGGLLVIMETLGTGFNAPAAPTADLDAYYTFLEEDHGFQRTVISTDYEFDDLETAVAQTEFFFGPDLARKIRANGWARVPEWTGVWHKRS